MASRQGMIRTTIALGIAFTLAAPLTASAQAGRRSRPRALHHRAEALHRPVHRAAAAAAAAVAVPPPYTPAPGARDLRSVLFNWGWHLGMLRSDQELDLIASLEYQGKGTMQVDGQPCNVTKYRTSISYQTSGERIQITGTRPNGQSLFQRRSAQWRVRVERR